MNDELKPSLLPYTYRAVRWKAHKFFTVLCSDGQKVPAVLQDYGHEGLGADLAATLELGQVVALIFSNLVPQDAGSPGTMKIDAQVVRIEGRRHGFVFCGPQDPFLVLKSFSLPACH